MADVQSSIAQRLIMEGLDPQCGDGEKVVYLWQLYQQSEEVLNESRVSEKRIEAAQKEEMREVEEYVEHIRQLSDERESLIQELETENEQLKAELATKGDGNDGSVATVNQDETVEMLLQQGLSEIAHSTTNEQIAFLLVERARLIDELESEQPRSQAESVDLQKTDFADGRTSAELQRTLERERTEFEEELHQQHQTVKQMREKMKRSHEEEMSMLLEENNKMEEDLMEARKKVQQFEEEVVIMREDLIEKQNELEYVTKQLPASSGLSRPPSPNRAASDVQLRKIIMEKTKLETEMIGYRNEIRSLEREKANLTEELDLSKEDAVRVRTAQQQLQLKNKNLRNDLDETEQQLDDAEAAVVTLKREKSEMATKLQETQQELKNFQIQDTQKDTMQNIIEVLSNDKKALAEQLDELRVDIHDLRAEKQNLTLEKQDLVKAEMTLTAQMVSLRQDMEEVIQEKQTLINERNLLLLSKAELDRLKQQLTELIADKDHMTKEKDVLKKEKENMNIQIETMEGELAKARIDAQEYAKQQIVLGHLREQKENLSNQVSTLKSDLEDSRKRETEWLEQQKKDLSKEKDQANQYKKEIGDMTAKLQLTLEELGKASGLLETERRRSTEAERRQKESESHLSEQQSDGETTQQAMMGKINMLEKKVRSLQDELFNTQEELHLNQDNFEQELEEIIAAKNSAVTQLSVVQTLQQQQEDALTGEKNDLHKRNKDLETSLRETDCRLQQTHHELEAATIDNTSIKENVQKLESERNKQQQTLVLLHELQCKLEMAVTEKQNLEQKTDRLSAEKAAIQELLTDAQMEATNIRDERAKVQLELKKLKQNSDEQVRNLENKMDQLEKQSVVIVTERDEARSSLEDLREMTKPEDSSKQNQLEAIQRERDVAREELEVLRTSSMTAGQTAHQLQDKLDSAMRVTEEAKQESKREKVALLNSSRDQEIRIHQLKECLEKSENECESLKQDRKHQKRTTSAVIRDLEVTRDAATETLDKAVKERNAAKIEVEKLKLLSEKESKVTEVKLSDKQRELQQAFSERDSLQVNLDKLTKTTDSADGAKTTHSNSNELQKKLDQATNRCDIVTKERDSLRKEMDELQSKYDINTAEFIQPKQIPRLDSGISSATSTANDGMYQKLQDLQKQNEMLKIERDTLKRDADNQFTASYNSSTFASLPRQNDDAFAKTIAQLQIDLEAVSHDRDRLKRETEMRLTSGYGGAEKQGHVDQIGGLERLSGQLESDNQELAMKLTEILAEKSDLEQKMQKEQKCHAELEYHNNRQLKNAEEELSNAKERLRCLQDETHQLQSKLIQVESENLGKNAKFESTISRLRVELDDAKARHRAEVADLSHRLESYTASMRENQTKLAAKEQEFAYQQTELSRARSTAERLEMQLDNEMKMHSDKETRNIHMEQEVNKAWGQLKALMEKNSSLEASKRALEEDLERKSSSSRQAETLFAQKSADLDSGLRSYKNRAEMAEHKAEKLQRELEEVSLKLETVEQQLYQSEAFRSDLQIKRDEVIVLKNKLQEDVLQRSILEQTIGELKQQVNLLKRREGNVSIQNQELQHKVLDMESRIVDMRDRSDSASDMQQVSDVNKSSMVDQIQHLQKDIKELQYELLTANEQQGIQNKKYDDRKYRTKTKLLKAREIHTHERSKLHEQFINMDEDLRLTRVKLNKEIEWKDKMQRNYQHLLQEKRKLLTKLSEQDESMRDQARDLSSLQSQLRMLSPDSPGPTIGTSGIGNSMNSIWDQDQGFEHVPRTSTSMDRLSMGLLRPYPSIDLYPTTESMSERSFDHVFEA